MRGTNTGGKSRRVPLPPPGASDQPPIPFAPARWSLPLPVLSSALSIGGRLSFHLRSPPSAVPEWRPVHAHIAAVSNKYTRVRAYTPRERDRERESTLTPRVMGALNKAARPGVGRSRAFEAPRTMKNARQRRPTWNRACEEELHLVAGKIYNPQTSQRKGPLRARQETDPPRPPPPPPPDRLKWWRKQVKRHHLSLSLTFISATRHPEPADEGGYQMKRPALLEPPRWRNPSEPSSAQQHSSGDGGGSHTPTPTAWDGTGWGGRMYTASGGGEPSANPRPRYKTFCGTSWEYM